MLKIKLEDFIKILSSDVLKSNSCIEMNFCIDNAVEYEDCWMGKMPDNDTINKEIYWYGLVEDGSQSYNYACFEEILNAKVFNNKSICDIWERVTWYSLDGCNIEEMLQYYIDDDLGRPIRSAPKGIK
ncbi:hypothetical protein [Alkaliphilus sp. B6464]|uniref:hypothetical protein n=1 Tax=Alkaliphilus sp. B6464 TaxID=2731219 RepID=UPI001BAAAA7E|nr:hypothetical protein [Alkaliphilus sp. B6464]QUH20384.1 hypothetical protein HYG84_11075 [Alkaliphilus sp. B6464]